MKDFINNKNLNIHKYVFPIVLTYACNDFVLLGILAHRLLNLRASMTSSPVCTYICNTTTLD